MIYREKANVSKIPSASGNNTHSIRQQVFILRRNQLFLTSWFRINHKRLQLSSGQNVISKAEDIASTTGIEKPTKQTSGLQNHKLKQALAQYISRLKRGKGKNKEEPMKRDSRQNEGILRSRGSNFRWKLLRTLLIIPSQERKDTKEGARELPEGEWGEERDVGDALVEASHSSWHKQMIFGFKELLKDSWCDPMFSLAVMIALIPSKSQGSVTCETNAPLWISRDMSRQQKGTIATIPRWCGQISRW